MQAPSASHSPFPPYWAREAAAGSSDVDGFGIHPATSGVRVVNLKKAGFCSPPVDRVIAELPAWLELGPAGKGGPRCSKAWLPVVADGAVGSPAGDRVAGGWVADGPR